MRKPGLACAPGSIRCRRENYVAKYLILKKNEEKRCVLPDAEKRIVVYNSRI